MSEQMRNEIREAVNESLLEAIRIANEKDSKNMMKWVINILQILLVPLIGWLLLNSVEIQKDIILLQAQVSNVNEHLMEHVESMETSRLKNTILHHTATDVISDCNACHNPPSQRPKKK